MQKVRFVIMDSVFFEHANAFERAFQALNVNVEFIKIPYFLVQNLNTSRLNDIRKIIKSTPSDVCLIFCPGLAEFFLEGVDLQFSFSAYKSWCPQHVRVIPHVWTNIDHPNSVEHLKWNEKPPLRLGFMGTSYVGSKVGGIASRLPVTVKEWLLRGTYLKRLNMLAHLYQNNISLKYINTFARAEALRILETKKYDHADANVEIVDTKGFGGSNQDKQRFIEHLQRMTYVICPRGSENFSIRAYEALMYGRIPVIIDTDMVLPKEIDWDRVSIKVPYGSLDKIYDVILNDYHSHTADEFALRQELALSTMKQLQSMSWLSNVLRETMPRSR